MRDRTLRHDPTPARVRRVLATVAAALVPLACGHSTPETTSPDIRPSPSRGGGALAGTEWVLTEFRGGPPLGGAEITLVFDDSSAGGYAGCNHYGGEPVVMAGTVRLDALVSTARACEDARLMDQEADYLAFLAETNSWEIEDDALTLDSESGGTLAFRAARER